jgi:hypothetical protein
MDSVMMTLDLSMQFIVHWGITCIHCDIHTEHIPTVTVTVVYGSFMMMSILSKSKGDDQ